MKFYFVLLALFAVVISQEITSGLESAGIACEDDYLTVTLSRVSGDKLCNLRVSDVDQKKTGLLLLDKITANHVYCLNPGHYYISCTTEATIKVQYLTNAEEVVLNAENEYSRFLLLDFEVAPSELPNVNTNSKFDTNTPITGEEAYPMDWTTEKDTFECNQSGYLEYLAKFPIEIKSTPRAPEEEGFMERLEYFKENCVKIHDWNTRNKYQMEFTFYADWSAEEFEAITNNRQHYSGYSTPVPSTIPPQNNTNYRYLMPSLDPCNDEGSNLREYISKPQNCSVAWAFAITNSIEYAIKKLYLEEYDQIISVALSAQELIDCVAKEHDLEGEACQGLPIAWGFDYIYENGIAYRQFYPHTNVEGTCVDLEEEKKYKIDGYEKPQFYNKHGLMELMKKGPVAVTLGLDPEFFQFYRNDRAEGPYFDTAYYKPSVYGVAIEYYQYEDATDVEAEWPYFAVETRLRACDSYVFRLPMLQRTSDANIAGIAAFAIRPIVSELPTQAPVTFTDAPTTEAPTELPTTEPPTTEPPTTELPTTEPPTTEPPTTEPPTTEPPTTEPPTTEPPTTLPPTTLPPTTPAPSGVIYDPFIYGDNTNFADANTCLEQIPEYDEILAEYLAVRDAYPEEALYYSRVIALQGVTADLINAFHESLKNQKKGDGVDLVFMSANTIYGKEYFITQDLVEPLISMAQYTYPKKVTFGYGQIYKEGFETILNYMINNKEYFKNLAELNILYSDILTGNVADSVIVDAFTQICDANNFPALTTVNLGGHQWTGISLKDEIANVCGEKVMMSDYTAIHALNVCYDTTYYDVTTQEEKDQCRYTWNWEYDYNYIYGQDVYPYPTWSNTPCPTTTLPTTLPPTTEPPTTEPPTTEPPTTEPPTTEPPTTLPPTTLPPTTLPPTTLPPTTPVPTTPVPEYAVYDPFMYTDNWNYLEEGNTCKNYDEVVDEYLAARDKYPDALYQSRIIALQAPTDYVITKFTTSISNKFAVKPADVPIDLYFSNNEYLETIDVNRVESLLNLAQYTLPSTVTFFNTHLEMSGFEKILEYMIANKESFVNLHTLVVRKSDLNIGFTADMKTSISEKITEICNEPAFEKLVNINISGNDANNELPAAISSSCSRMAVISSMFTSTTNICEPAGNNYYTAEQYEQCYHTWHVEANGYTIHPYGTVNFDPYPECN